MSSRTKRIFSMVNRKDQIRLESLAQSNTVPRYETTEGCNLAKIDVNSLKATLFSCGDSGSKYISFSSVALNNEVSDYSLDVVERVSEKDNWPVSKMFASNEDSHENYHNIKRNSKTGSFESGETLEPVEANNNICHKNLRNRKEKGPKFISKNELSSESDPFTDSDSEYIPSSVASENTNADDFEKFSDFESDQHSVESPVEKLPLINNHNINNRQDHGQFNDVGEVKVLNRCSDGKLKRDKKVHCVFCETNVTNFTRHLIRRHDTELEVVKLTSMPKKSKQRKFLIEEIRKRGNFVNSYGKEGFINPVRRPEKIFNKKAADYLPCISCKGFFTRTYLARHLKKCHKKTENGDSKHAQVKGLTLAYMSGQNNFEDLRIHVFPHMQSDDITKVVMNDYLIKYYGQRYFRCHKEKHLINTVSQRMRELARFLKTLQKMNPKLDTLTDYLKPQYFEILVDATNELAGYDSDNDTFKSPSLALRWATVLKQACDILIFLAARDSNETKKKEAKTLKQMIETQFRFHVSTNANKDLSTKQWKKGSMLPLTEDVIKMNEYVIAEEKKWSEKLADDPSNKIFVRNLMEALLAHVILLNRKRSGEAQRITIEDYLRNEDECGVQDIYESLTVTEKALVANIKRIVIRGKKGRAVPVIFTKNMQEHIEILLKSRKVVASSNPYLFSNPNTDNSFLWSYKILKKFAESCNLKNIEAITATCLRKHVATIAQLISMQDNDLEQLSTHLGHEKATHLNFYRKTDDKLQIAKVSKLLLLMEKKTLSEFRGQTLEEIDLEIPDLDDNGDTEKEITNNNKRKARQKAKASIENREETIDTRQSKGDTTKYVETIDFMETNATVSINEVKQTEDLVLKNGSKSRRVLIPWTQQQKKFAQIFFAKHLKMKKPPKRCECDELKKLHSAIFANKTWAQIKIFIVNLYNKKK